MISALTVEMSGAGTCPVCNGTKVQDGRACMNCGGQYQFGHGPVGKVFLNRDGQPCRHSYEPVTVGRCLTRYVCKHCRDEHLIDSGD